MMRIIPAALAAGLLVPVLGLSGISSAAAAPRSTFHDHKLCDTSQQNPVLCMADSGSRGSSVTTQGLRRPSVDQEMDVVGTKVCGTGKVSGRNECPFTRGSRLNATFNGDPIVNLRRHVGQLYYDDQGGIVVARTSTIGSVWVQHDGEYINVYAVNHSGSNQPLGAVSEPLGQPVSIGPGPTQWTVEAP